MAIFCIKKSTFRAGRGAPVSAKDEWIFNSQAKDDVSKFSTYCIKGKKCSPKRFKQDAEFRFK
jgi:hypothetical protein